MLVKYSDYQNSRNLSWEILIREEVTELPVKIVTLCRNMGIRVKYSDLGENSGEARIIDGNPMIFISQNEPIERQRFTVAHELGHILLGHVGKYRLVNREPSAKDNPIEQEANVFASRLLAPACILWGCGVKSAEDIAGLCSISYAAAEFRWNRFKILLDRDKFLTSPLEYKVYRKFLPYIKKNKL